MIFFVNSKKGKEKKKGQCKRWQIVSHKTFIPSTNCLLNPFVYKAYSESYQAKVFICLLNLFEYKAYSESYQAKVFIA